MTLAKQFQNTFGANLKQFLSSITGFDIVKLDDHLGCGKRSMQDVITERYGATAVDLVKEIMGHSKPLEVDIKALFAEKSSDSA